MTQHSPGPWTLRKSGDGKCISITGSAANYWVDLDCEVDSDDKDLDVAMANARLIAAAPDLLIVAEEFLTHEGESCLLLGVEGWCGECLKCAARAAVAKAKGKQ
jgi:hypothetical protein